MQPDFEWQVRDEGAASSLYEKSPSLRGRRVYGRLLALAIVLLIAAAGLWLWLQRQEAQAAEAVQAVARAEDRAWAAGDRQALVALQDPNVGKSSIADTLWACPPLSHLQAGPVLAQA